MYIKDNNLPFYEDKKEQLKYTLLKNIKSVEPFNRISYTTLLSIGAFSHNTELQDESLNINDETEYNNLLEILEQNDSDSSEIKNTLLNPVYTQFIIKVISNIFWHQKKKQTNY